MICKCRLQHTAEHGLSGAKFRTATSLHSRHAIYVESGNAMATPTQWRAAMDVLAKMLKTLLMLQTLLKLKPLLSRMKLLPLQLLPLSL